MPQKIIIIGGPTASGKTALALEISRKIEVVIINADSQQVYREIPIITAQPNKAEQQENPHKLYGIISASEYFSVANWLELVKKEIQETFSQGKTPLLVGGTGMYIKSLIEGIANVPPIGDNIRNNVRAMADAEGVLEVYKILLEKDAPMAAKLNPADKQRVLRAYEVYLQTGKSLLYWQNKKITPLFPQEIFKVFFLFPDKQEVYSRCNGRFINMIENGALDEIATLQNLQIAPQMPAMNALGVPELLAYRNGQIEYNEMVGLAQQKTRNYIKRQFTFFRNQVGSAVKLGPAEIIADGVIARSL